MCLHRIQASWYDHAWCKAKQRMRFQQQKSPPIVWQWTCAIERRCSLLLGRHRQCHVRPFSLQRYSVARSSFQIESACLQTILLECRPFHTPACFFYFRCASYVRWRWRGGRWPPGNHSFAEIGEAWTAVLFASLESGRVRIRWWWSPPAICRKRPLFVWRLWTLHPKLFKDFVACWPWAQNSRIWQRHFSHATPTRASSCGYVQGSSRWWWWCSCRLMSSHRSAVQEASWSTAAFFKKPWLKGQTNEYQSHHRWQSSYMFQVRQRARQRWPSLGIVLEQFTH